MRYRTVIDMHFVNRMQAYGWPLLVMVIALVIVLSIGAIVGTQGAEARAEMYEGMTWSGAIFSLLGPLIGYGFVSMGQYFPLALGLGVTRREFAAGQSLLFLGNALAYALLVTLGKTVEAATGGFGLGIRFFDVFYTGTGASWQTFVQTFLLIVAILFLGAAITSAFLRFGQPILWISGSLLGLLGVAIVAGIVLVDGFGGRLLELLTLSWGSWMGVIAAVGLVAAGTWVLLVRRTQVR